MKKEDAEFEAWFEDHGPSRPDYIHSIHESAASIKHDTPMIRDALMDIEQRNNARFEQALQAMSYNAATVNARVESLLKSIRTILIFLLLVALVAAFK
ncbi:MAG: hypothetical protein HXX19_11240 [Rhodoferax sp.]|nr:hypothetical protein [Rhodoferax sp.]